MATFRLISFRHVRVGYVLGFLACFLVEASAVWAQGVISPGIGPVNRSMGGAAVAAPLDGIGALHWNPATLTALESAVDIGFEMPISETRMSSTLPADAFGPGFPPVTLTGESRSDAGVVPLFSNALVHSPRDKIWTLGLGLYSIGGLFTNFPASTTNALLTAPPPAGFGTGATYSRLGLLQMAPTAAFQVTDSLSIGIAPTFTAADLQLGPMTLAAPDDANMDGFATFPDAYRTRLHWGFGTQAGVYWVSDAGFSLGASVKSPVWFERFTFNSSDEVGNPRTLTLDADLPMIVSVGGAFRGIERLLVAIDLRWTDYDNTDGFKQSGFNPDGSARGVGWRSVLSISTGAQYWMNERIALRSGYFYTQNPIPDSQTSFNVAAPAFYQRIASCGVTYDLTHAITITLAYYHSFHNRISGPIQTPGGPIPGSNVEMTMFADSLAAGFTMRY